MKLNKRKCKECGVDFQKITPLQSVCSIPCAANRSYKQNKVLREKKSRKADRETKQSLMTKGEWMQLLQTSFNTFIRIRDKDLGCVSCGRTNVEEFHAGHYIATTHSYLRFDENNVWKQCSQCNTHLRGNSIPYRIELVKRIGLRKVMELEDSRHKRLDLSIPEIKEKIAEYKYKIKDLKPTNK